MQIGQLAHRTQVSARALRHYDRLGLLASSRTENGYRVFTEADVDQVRLIRLFLSVGFRLDEIRHSAPCFQNGSVDDLTVPTADVLAFYQRKLTEVDAHLSAVQRMRDTLHAQMRRLQEQMDNASPDHPPSVHP
ncbi:MerR family transcriptional regulator [Deinococcus sp. HMF7620]|uniref:MerR family transcriptional regulator n=1 Tax=Deinococcus arboris TaxID=2682977 RepID=A0A7C9HPX6_9DEIO|nr:MerR family transcriptional regulator [Deinococcus arboris]